MPQAARRPFPSWLPKENELHQPDRHCRSGTAETTFKIVPKAVQLTSLTPGKNKLTVQWKKGTGITGYEIQYSTSSKFTNVKTVTIREAGQTSTEIKKLTRGRTYYVRIRAYKTVKGVPFYSAWSKAKKATVK